jgi:hypothetical protein
MAEQQATKPGRWRRWRERRRAKAERSRGIARRVRQGRTAETYTPGRVDWGEPPPGGGAGGR